MFKNTSATVTAVVVPWILTGAIAIGGVGYLSSATDTSATQQVTIAEQQARIDTLTRTSTDLQARLGTCLATAADYRGYIEENKAHMQSITAKWGINYSAPLRDMVVVLDSATRQFDCN